MRVREETEGGMEETEKHSRGKSKTYNTVNTDGYTKEDSKQEYDIYNCM